MARAAARPPPALSPATPIHADATRSPDVQHRRHKGLNNRTENSRQPIRRREKIMKRFKSPAQLQRFASVHDPIAKLFHFLRHALSSADHRDLRNIAMATWREIAHLDAV
jgi:putative transposase